MSATPPDEIGGFVTLGEVARRVADVQSTVHELVSKLDRDYVRRSDLDNVDRRLTAVENTITWAVRVIVGAVILALLGLVLVQGGPAVT